jgi:hypothetical protein
MKKFLLYGLGLTLTMAFASPVFAGNDGKTAAKKECKDKKGCSGKCSKNGKKSCCKDHKSM